MDIALVGEGDDTDLADLEVNPTDEISSRLLIPKSELATYQKAPIGL